MHEILMLLTANLPMKTIEIGGEPYLERYHVKTDTDGTQHWLHRFLRNDSERHLHSHPWSATSTILCGAYSEQLDDGCLATYCAPQVNTITPDKLHRVVAVASNTWTYMIVNPDRMLSWAFIDESGARTPVLTSPENWHMSCKSRENSI